MSLKAQKQTLLTVTHPQTDLEMRSLTLECYNSQYKNLYEIPMHIRKSVQTT